MSGKRSIRFRSGIDLQAERAKSGFTQKQLAEKSGMHVHTIRYWEAKKDQESNGGMFSTALNRMADAMDIPPLYEDYAVRSDKERLSKEMLEWLGLSWLHEKPKPARKRHCGAGLSGGCKCRKSPVKTGYRCAQHGGLSTGPKTPAGIERIKQAQYKRWHSPHC